MPDEVDLLLQYCEEIHGKVTYFMELVAEENSVMEWSYTEFETGETYVRQTKCEEVAGKVLDMSGLEMEWTGIEVETGEMNMGRNNCEEVTGKLSDVIGHEADANYEMKWEVIELETGELYVGQKYYEE